MLRYFLVIAMTFLFAGCEKNQLVEEVQPMKSADLTQIQTDHQAENNPPLSEEAIQQLNGQAITDLISRLHESEQKISSKYFATEKQKRGGSFHALVKPLPSRNIIVLSEWEQIDFHLRPSVQAGMSAPLQYVLMHRLADWILHQKDVMARLDSPHESLNGTDASLLEDSQEQEIQY